VLLSQKAILENYFTLVQQDNKKRLSEKKIIKSQRFYLKNLTEKKGIWCSVSWSNKERESMCGEDRTSGWQEDP